MLWTKQIESIFHTIQAFKRFDVLQRCQNLFTPLQTLSERMSLELTSGVRWMNIENIGLLNYGVVRSGMEYVSLVWFYSTKHHLLKGREVLAFSFHRLSCFHGLYPVFFQTFDSLLVSWLLQIQQALPSCTRMSHSLRKVSLIYHYVVSSFLCQTLRLRVVYVPLLAKS